MLSNSTMKKKKKNRTKAFKLLLSIMQMPERSISHIILSLPSEILLFCRSLMKHH